jgi:mannose-6-phosphate isomerase-like protein (cupin superfamily)
MIEIGDQSYFMAAGQVLEIMPYQPHRFTGISKEPVRIFETSTQHFESDSIRIEKGD